HAVGERVTVAPIGDGEVVALLERADRADRDRLLPLAEMRRALDLALHEQLLHLLLEEPDLEHLGQPADPLVRLGRTHDIASFGSGRSGPGSSIACLNVSRNRAASTPSTARWSALSVAVSKETRAGASPPTQRSTGRPVARIATCGGVTIAVKALTSNMPRLLSVNVAPLVSAGRRRWAGARSTRSARPTAVSATSSRSAPSSAGATSPSSSPIAIPTLTSSASSSPSGVHTALKRRLPIRAATHARTSATVIVIRGPAPS